MKLWSSFAAFFKLLLQIDAHVLLNTTGDGIWIPVPLTVVNTRIQHWLTFSVKGPQSAQLGLGQYFNSQTSKVFLKIGNWDNRECYLKVVNGNRLQSVRTYGILSSDEFRPMWVSWEGGVIAFGTGTQVGTNKKLSVSSPISVHYLTVTSVNNAFIQWKIDASLCKTVEGFARLQSDALLNPDPLEMNRTKILSTRASCADACFCVNWCRSFSYKSTQQECRMFDSAPQLSQLTGGTGWETWVMKH